MRLKLILLAMEILSAYEDGKVSREEFVGFLNSVVKTFDLKLENEFCKIFIEQDGDVHIILASGLAGKIGLELKGDVVS